MAELSTFKQVHHKVPCIAQRDQSRAGGQKWKPPTWPYLKVNFDAAFDKMKEMMGMRIVIRDCEGDLLASLLVSNECVNSVFLAESNALLRAMELCQDLAFTLVEFEGDAKAVVDVVKSNVDENSWLGQVIEDIKQMMNRFSSWKLSFAHRMSNKVAHEVAKLALRFDSERVWLEEGPL
ncbi:uncharacterized protein LOC121240790 [Juglans microcarpa x Juglans regia]|uniref:uncharacterized protein LOC121240790 n=1 Tax=Juglans microcarpa x Juglans regia TaxID=2249226 RepID=UPI001B7D931F|nr:uncharacterized protein LOC121240790 [Juglans microcarpa x Juglans regia]